MDLPGTLFSNRAAQFRNLPLQQPRTHLLFNPTIEGVANVPDKDPKNIEKLREQAEDKKEEELEYKHDTPAQKEHDREREEDLKEAEIDREYGEQPEPTEA